MQSGLHSLNSQVRGVDRVIVHGTGPNTINPLFLTLSVCLSVDSERHGRGEIEEEQD